jgi:nitrate/nitrite transporter NarK
MLALFAVAPLVVVAGWAGAFVAMAGALLVIAAILAALLKDTPRGAAPGAGGWQRLASDQSLHGLALAHTLCYGVYMTVMPWTVDYLVTTFGGDLAYMASVSTIITIGALAARVGGGYAARVWGEGRVLLYSISGTVALTALLGASPWVWLSLAVLVGLGVTCNLPFGSVFSLANSRFGEGMGGRAMSLISLSANTGAFVLPLMVGQLATSTGGFGFSFYSLAAIELAVLLYIMYSPWRRAVILGGFTNSPRHKERYPE